MKSSPLKTVHILPGTHIDAAADEAYAVAKEENRAVEFKFNDVFCLVTPKRTVVENRTYCRSLLGLPPVDPPFHPKTASDALARWDKGGNLFSIEMGGLGPGYEQCIQILAMEMIRDNLDKPFPATEDPGINTWGDATAQRLFKEYGFSGAQFGAAREIAYRAIRDGWEKMLNSAPEGRRIQITKHFPKAPNPNDQKTT